MSECNDVSMRELLERLSRLEERLGQIEKRISPPTSDEEDVIIELSEAVQPPKPSTIAPPFPRSSPVQTPVSPPPLPTEPQMQVEPRSVIPPAPAPKAETPGRPWEEVIGQKWMLIVGLVVLLLGGVFFLKYAYDQGWVNPVMRVITTTIAGVVMIGLGEWAFRRKMTYFAAGVFGAGIVILYFASWAASPNGWYFPAYKMLTATQAFIAMCVVTILGVALAVRSNLITSAIIALLGALLTPILMSSGENRQVELMSYMLLVDVGFLAVAFWKRWIALVPITLAGTLILFAGWFVKFNSVSPVGTTLAFGWAFFGLFLLYVLLASRIQKITLFLTQPILLVTGVAMMRLLVGENLPSSELLLSVFLLDAIVLAVCQLARWHWVRFIVFFWTVTLLFLIWLERCGARPTQDVRGELLLWAQWAFGFFGLFTADILARPFCKRLDGNNAIEVILAMLVTGEGFLATYLSLWDIYPDTMGALAAGFGAFAFVVFLVLSVAKNWRVLREGYLAAAMGMLLLAIPLQFDDSYVTFCWAAVGLGLILVAKWRGGLLMLMVPVVAIALATVHLSIQLMTNPILRENPFTLDGVGISNGLLAMLAVSLGMWIMAGVISVGKCIVSKSVDFFFIVVLVVLGGTLIAVRSIVELPALGATGCWLGSAVLLLIAGWAMRNSWWKTAAMVGLILTTVKWVMIDTITQRALHGSNLSYMIVLNPQFLLGLSLAVLFLVMAFLNRRETKNILMQWPTAMIVVSSVLVFWAGNFEVDRYVEIHRVTLHEPAKALQMGLSLWWAIWAAVLLIVGFVSRVPALRYTAIAMFGLTVSKVLVVDMQDVVAGYRILTFLALGGVLVAASLLYHRFYRIPKKRACDSSTDAS